MDVKWQEEILKPAGQPIRIEMKTPAENPEDLAAGDSYGTGCGWRF